MKQLFFAVFDQKVGAYLRPFTVRSSGEALRGWVDICNDRESEVNKHPEDYTLFELGSFDPETGRVEALSTPHSHGKAIEFLKTNPQMNMLVQEGVVR